MTFKKLQVLLNRTYYQSSKKDYLLFPADLSFQNGRKSTEISQFFRQVN